MIQIEAHTEKRETLLQGIIGGIIHMQRELEWYPVHCRLEK